MKFIFSLKFSNKKIYSVENVKENKIRICFSWLYTKEGYSYNISAKITPLLCRMMEIIN